VVKRTRGRHFSSELVAGFNAPGFPAVLSSRRDAHAHVRNGSTVKARSEELHLQYDRKQQESAERAALDANLKLTLPGTIPEAGVKSGCSGFQGALRESLAAWVACTFGPCSGTLSLSALLPQRRTAPC
jgi:hypothetical protein